MRMGKKNLKRTAALLLALCLALPLGGCFSLPDVEYDTRLNFLTNSGASVFRVVYPQDCPDDIFQAAGLVADVMQRRLGVPVALVDDMGGERAPDLVLPYEILVGKTARAQTQDVFRTLGQDEWVVRLVGQKIVIVGETTRATMQALDHFISEVLGISDIESITPDPLLKIELNYNFYGCYMIDSVDNLLKDSVLERAPYSARVLYPVPMLQSDSDALTIATLQGLAAAQGSEQIVWADAAYEEYAPYLAEQQGLLIEATDDDGNPWTLASLLWRYRQGISGYILCDPSPQSESVAVAISLAHHLGAVVVTPENEPIAMEAGLMCLMDATDKDDAWLRQSEYFALLDTSVAVEQTWQNVPALIDYVVMTGGYCYFYAGQDEYAHAQHFKFLETGARVLLGSDVEDEQMISSLSNLGLQAIEAGTLLNLSTASGFYAKAELGKKPQSAEPEQGVHTVCFVMANAHDLGQMITDYTVDDAWYASELRGTVAVSWGLNASMSDALHPLVSYIDATATEKDDFLLQFSSPKYSYSADWQASARLFFATSAATAMARMGVHYLQIPQGAFDRDMHAVLLKHEEIGGLICLDPLDGAYLSGEFMRVLGKPVVSARYYLNAEQTDVSLTSIVLSLNSGETDPSKVNAYSLVVIDAGVGLNEQHELVEGGDPMALLQSLVSHLADNVDVVTVSEFMARIDANVE